MTAYERLISDWSSDICSSDLTGSRRPCNRQNNGRERHARQHVSTGWPSHLRAPGTGTWRIHLATFRRVDGRCGPPAHRTKLTHVAPCMDTYVNGCIVVRAEGQSSQAKNHQIRSQERREGKECDK